MDMTGENINELKKLHQVELEIMDEIHRICIKHNISYFLDSGTALGAIRHGGFIPWDDDVDIGMLREDYEKFLEVAKEELSPGYFLQNNCSERNYYKFNTKIRKKGTFFPEKAASTLENKGIFIDIFPFDYIEDERDNAIAHINRSRRQIKKILYTRPDYVAIRMRDKVIRTLLKYRSYEKYRHMYENCIRKNNRKPTNHVTCFIYSMIQKQHIVFRYSDIYPVRPVQFEDRTYMIMNNPDAYLSEMYGDYMVLPPEEKRICHVDGKIIFDLGVKKDENG